MGEMPIWKAKYCVHTRWGLLRNPQKIVPYSPAQAPGKHRNGRGRGEREEKQSKIFFQWKSLRVKFFKTGRAGEESAQDTNKAQHCHLPAEETQSLQSLPGEAACDGLEWENREPQHNNMKAFHAHPSSTTTTLLHNTSNLPPLQWPSWAGIKQNMLGIIFIITRNYYRKFRLRLHSVYSKNLQRSGNTNSWDPR